MKCIGKIIELSSISLQLDLYSDQKKSGEEKKIDHEPSVLDA